VIDLRGIVSMGARTEPMYRQPYTKGCRPESLSQRHLPRNIGKSAARAPRWSRDSPLHPRTAPLGAGSSCETQECKRQNSRRQGRRAALFLKNRSTRTASATQSESIKVVQFIAVVDDDESVRSATANLLRSYRWAVRIYASG